MKVVSFRKSACASVRCLRTRVVPRLDDWSKIARTASIFIAICLVFATRSVCGSTLVFQEGVDGYIGTVDTDVVASGDGYTTAQNLDRFIVDKPDVGTQGEEQGLLRFENIFGPGARQIPFGAQVVNATLTLKGYDTGTLERITLHEMLIPWDESSTGSSLDGGISADNLEARETAVSVIEGPFSIIGEIRQADVTVSLQAWSQGDSNYGWVLLPDGVETDGWAIWSSEAASMSDRPKLTVEYVVPEPSTLALLGLCAVACSIGLIARALRLRKR